MKDYRVECNDCGAEYTPKGETHPENCYNCVSTNIEWERITGITRRGP